MTDSGLERIIDVIVRTLDPDTIILFGSRARGDAREDSDFDICVLKDGISERRPGRTDCGNPGYVLKKQG